MQVGCGVSATDMASVSSLQGEQLSSDQSAVSPFTKKLEEIMEEKSLTLEQVYNCDETGLCYRMLPDKTLAKKSEKGAKGMKKQKDRVTLMACANATGSHKLPLVFIHKSKNPRCFKHVNQSALPVKYSSQRSAWMDTAIFTKWFHEEFVPSVKKHLTNRGLAPKALLLLDNAPSHPDITKLVSHDKQISAMFLPANTTSLIQPMDQGVLENLKKRYKKSLLRKLIMADEEGLSMITFVKGINIKDVVYMIADAWNDVLSSTLCKSWFKLLGSNISKNPQTSDSNASDSADLSESCESIAKQLDSSLTSEDIAEWLAADSEDPGYQYATDEEIIQQVLQGTISEESDSEEDEDGPSPLTCTHGEAASMLDTALQWYEQQKEATSTSLMVLKGVRDLACQKRNNNLRQRTLESYV